MSLPTFDVQCFLFESLGSIAADLFDKKDKYKLFAAKIWPLLAGYREELAENVFTLQSVSMGARRCHRGREVS
jgi:hypothetical protein